MTCVLCTFIDMRKKDRPIFFQNDSFDKMYLDTCEKSNGFYFTIYLGLSAAIFRHN